MIEERNCEAMMTNEFNAAITLLHFIHFIHGKWEVNEIGDEMREAMRR